MLATLDGFFLFLQAIGLVRNLLGYTTGGYLRHSASSDVSGDNITRTISGFMSSNNVYNASELPNIPLVSKMKRGDDNPCYVEPYYAPPVVGQTFPPFDRAKASVYRYRQQQSVNLGSWFVQERWMVPSLFTCAAGSKASELDIASGWGSTTAARAVLERHWDSFVTQADFDYLASIGINTIRLPVGYWTLGPGFCQDTPFAAVAEVYQNSWNRLLRAISMAGQSGIGVLIDLHGAVGSQNGQTHSGVSDGATNLFDDPASTKKTAAALVFLMQQLMYVTNVVGIQLLNEPQDVPQLADFYDQTIQAMRQVSPEAASFPLYIHDGFDLERFSQYVANRPDFVVQDHHSYFVYTPSDVATSASGHTAAIRGSIAASLASASARQRRNLVIDEWSCALTPNSLAQESNPWQARRDFGQAQLDVYTTTTAGWSFWSYKKEACDNDPGWCFKAAVGNSLPPTFFSYAQQRTTDSSRMQAAATKISQMAPPSNNDILAKASLGKRATSPHHHRIASIHQRRQSSQMNATQRSFLKGYIDGFQAAQTFALQDLSRLGFVGQYTEDSIAAQGPGVIEPGTEQAYRDGMGNGIKDGEFAVASILEVT